MIDRSEIRHCQALEFWLRIFSATYCQTFRQPVAPRELNQCFISLPQPHIPVSTPVVSTDSSIMTPTIMISYSVRLVVTFFLFLFNSNISQLDQSQLLQLVFAAYLNIWSIDMNFNITVQGNGLFQFTTSSILNSVHLHSYTDTGRSDD